MNFLTFGFLAFFIKFINRLFSIGKFEDKCLYNLIIAENTTTTAGARF